MKRKFIINKKVKNVILMVMLTILIVGVVIIFINKAISILKLNEYRQKENRQYKEAKQEKEIKENRQENKIEQINSNIEQVENIEQNNRAVELTKYYGKAEQILENLTQEEIIAQIFLVGTFQNSNIKELKQKQFGGYLFFTDFFKDKTEQQIQNEIKEFQNTAKIPLLIAVDEEGGKVVRVSNNKKLIKEKFQSSSDIYIKGGFEAIKQDTINKSKFLENLGINLNLAPVVDIATNSNAYMYNRSFKQNEELTSIYAKTAIDQRTYDNIYKKDMEPFRQGIKEGAEVILISHNIVTNIDEEYPASLSPKIHNILRNDLNFNGIIMTDSINMGAIKEKYTTKDAIIKSILAGNDIIIILIDEHSEENYDDIINIVKEAIDDKIINYSNIYNSARSIIAWKYYKKLMN